MALRSTTDDLDDLVGTELTGTFRRWTPPSGASVARESAPPDGLHRYRLVRRLGGGGQGVAFLADRLNETGDDSVVIKIWRPSFVAENPEIARLVLEKESVALARLNERVPPTPFVARLLDGGEVAILQRFGTLTLPWLALEYVHGGALGTTLRERVKESVDTTGVAFGPARARRVLGSIVQGLLAIHEVGVVHRDLKPTNVVMCGFGEDELAKVVDFGLARPLGMKATFGSSIAVGTPGYAAPEQFSGTDIGPWSDVFSAAALAYFAITGEDMFGGSPTVQIARAYAGTFEPLASRPRVAAAWQNVKALPRIEAALRRATRRELSQRTPSVQELWASLEPAIRDCETSGLVSVSAGSARTLQDAAAQPWSFHVGHRSTVELGLRAVAFDPDGHALGAGRTGLSYWEGTRWVPLPPPHGLDARAIRVLRRLGPARWFAFSEHADVEIFTPRQSETRQRIGTGMALTAAAVVSERQFALVAARPGEPPRFYAFADGSWRAPLTVRGAAEISALTGAGDLYHGVGRDQDGKGIALTFGPDAGRVEIFALDSAPLLAVAVDGPGAVYATGAGGFAYRRTQGHPVLERVLSHRSLDVVAVDPAGVAWTAAVGRILRRPAVATGATWTPVWSDAAWTSPFVAIAPFAGMVVAAAADGSIVVGHQAL